MIRKYWSLISGSAQTILTYKVSFICSVLGDIVKTLVVLFMWLAVFRVKSQIADFNFQTMITYIIISQTLNNIYSFHNAAERAIISKIHQGTIGFELIRPINFNLARFMENLGQTFFQVIFAILSFILFALFIPQLLWPTNTIFALLFLISAIIGYLIMFTISLMSGLLSFWFENSWGLRMAKNTTINFLSGSLIPLSLLPNWLETVANVMPFKNIIYIPTNIYLGRYSLSEAMIQIVFQVVWVVVLWCISRVLFHLAIKQVRINGG